MKKKIPAILVFLTVFSVVLAIGYTVYQRSQSSPEAPVISFAAEKISVKTTAGDAELLKGVTATDPEDGDVTDSLLVEGMSSMTSNNDVTVSYVAFDSKNHMTRASRQVHFSDYTDPEFDLTQALCFKLSNNIDVIDCVKAVDAIDGDISSLAKFSLEDDSLTINSVGEHEIELRVTNSLGRTSRLTLTVEVTQTDPNPANITLDHYILYLNQGDTFNAREHVVGYTVNGVEREGSDGVVTSGVVNTNQSGMYSVNYSYTSGGVTSRTKLIVIVREAVD